jgi:hypothetical protein
VAAAVRVRAVVPCGVAGVLELDEGPHGLPVGGFEVGGQESRGELGDGERPGGLLEFCADAVAEDGRRWVGGERLHEVIQRRPC